MRIGYLVHFRGGSESGILRKVASQAATWQALGAEVGLFVATAPDSVSAWSALPQAVSVRTPPGGPLALFRERESLVRDVARWHPDAVYLRHGLVYPGIIRLARQVPCVIEINGDDLAEFRLTSRRRYLFARATRGLLLRRAAGLVFVTHELSAKPSFVDYHRPSVVIANGIDLASVEPAPPAQNDEPRLIFIGHPNSPWHGVEELLALAEANPTWRFDVIGPSPDDLDAHAANLDAHGTLVPAAYRRMLATADIAVGSLALYKAGIQEASTLKVREYLAAGLPVVIGHRDSDFLDGAPFILQVPNAASGIRSAMGSVRAFVDDWRGRRVPRSDIGHLDVVVKERDRLRFLEATVGG